MEQTLISGSPGHKALGSGVEYEVALIKGRGLEETGILLQGCLEETSWSSSVNWALKLNKVFVGDEREADDVYMKCGGAASHVKGMSRAAVGGGKDS